jgi:predicted NAD/FAD-dependent oxidoreductase
LLIVGAGMAGLTAARILLARGWAVTLLDKGRGVGGRMATRRIGQNVFDHGAQFFTVRDVRFREAVEEWKKAGLVADWFEEGGHTRYRGVTGMNSIAKHLAAGLDVRTGTRVTSAELTRAGWSVLCESGENFSADSLLLTAPAPQSVALLPAELRPALDEIQFDPCIALLVSLSCSSQVPAPGYVRPERGPIEWIADNTQKGISSGDGALTIHARADFSREYFEAPAEEAARLLLDAADVVGDWQLHRWKYSKPSGWSGAPCWYSDSPAPLAMAGDAFAGGRVEGAFLSGVAAAEALELNSQPPPTSSRLHRPSTSS